MLVYSFDCPRCGGKNTWKGYIGGTSYSFSTCPFEGEYNHGEHPELVRFLRDKLKSIIAAEKNGTNLKKVDQYEAYQKI